MPLIYRFPERCGARSQVDAGFVSHVDLAPTLAALAGIPGPGLTQGQALFGPDLALRPTPARAAALVEWRERAFQSQDPFCVVRCLITDEWKFVYYHGQACGELYDRLLAFLLENEPLPPRTNIF